MVGSGLRVSAGRAAAGVLLAGVLLAGVLLAGCGAAGAGGGQSPGGSKTVVELEALNGSGTTGTVTLAPGDGGGSEIRLSLENLPEPGHVYVGAVYRGGCPAEAGDQGNLPGPVEYRLVHEDRGAPQDEESIVQTLTSVSSGPEGGGSSVTPLPISTGDLLSGGPKHVDVHGEDEAIACADLPAANV